MHRLDAKLRQLDAQMTTKPSEELEQEIDWCWEVEVEMVKIGQGSMDRGVPSPPPRKSRDRGEHMQEARY